ncbi:MAG: hypothetical protein ACI85O_002826, partial [Saprospiraceae bacterium]
PEGISEEDWKGIFFPSFDIIFPTDFDDSNQLVLDNEQTYNYTTSTEFKGWVDGGGLDCSFTKSWEGSDGPTAAFNTFKDNFREIDIDVENNLVDGESKIRGYVFIPLLDKTEEFDYTIPIATQGLQVSFLDDNLENRIVFFNEDNDDQRLILTLKTAVFENNDRLSLSCDIFWESLDTDIKNLTNLKVWGDGQVGFSEPGGATAIPNVMGTYNGKYQLTVDSVAVGGENGEYAFNFISSILVGDEASGITGKSGPTKVYLVSYETRKEETGVLGSNSTNLFDSAFWDSGYWSTFSETPMEERVQRTVAFFPFYIPKQLTGGKLSGSGFIMSINDDPVWGNCFMGMANFMVLKPETFGVQIKILMGEKDGTMYWLAEAALRTNPIDYAKFGVLKAHATGAYASAKTKMKKSTKPPLKRQNASSNLNPDEPKPKSIKLGKMEIVEIRGRIYHNMMHSVEAECDISMPSMINLGANEEGDSNINTKQVLNDLRNAMNEVNLDEVINNMPPAKIQTILKDFKDNSISQFRLILTGLPAPDYDLIQDNAPGIAWSDFSASVTSYAHLELLYPAVDWPLILSEITMPDGSVFKWGDHLAGLENNHLDYYDFGELGYFKKLKTLEEIQEVFPVEMDFVVSNGLLTQGQWDDMVAELSIGSDVTLENGEELASWMIIYQKYPDLDWRNFLISIVNINWDTIWDNVMSGSATFYDIEPIDLKEIVQEYKPSIFGAIFNDYASAYTGASGYNVSPGEIQGFYSVFLESRGDLRDASADVVWNAFKAAFSGFDEAALNALEESCNALHQGFVAGNDDLMAALDGFLSPELVTTYNIQPNVDFGMMLYVRGQDILTKGKQLIVIGTMEFDIQNGGLGQLLFKIEAGSGNRMMADNIDDSFIRMKGCITYVNSTKTFIADVVAQSTKGPFCGQGSLHLKIAPNILEFNLGTKDFPIVVVPGCQGWGAVGWFEVNDKDNITTIGMGLGVTLASFNKSPKIGTDVCEFYAYADFYAALVAFGKVQIEPSFEMLEAGLTMGMGIDVGVNFSGFLCPFGNINVLHLYVGGDLTYEFDTQRLHGEVSGEAVLFSVISADFYFEFDENI